MPRFLTEWLYDEKTPFVFIILYFVGNLMSIFNYSFWFRFEADRYGQSTTDAYLTFVVIGGLVYVLWSGVHWMWAAKYVESRKQRFRHIGYGVWGVFLFHDLPLLIIEWHVILCCGGIQNGLQGVEFVLIWFEFLFSFVWAWTCYTWRMARFMNYWWGEDTSGVVFVTRGELEDARARSLSPPQLPMYEARAERQIQSPYATSVPEPMYASRAPQPPYQPRTASGYNYDDDADEPYYARGMSGSASRHVVVGREPDAFDRDAAAYHSGGSRRSPIGRRTPPTAGSGGGYYSRESSLPYGTGATPSRKAPSTTPQSRRYIIENEVVDDSAANSANRGAIDRRGMSTAGTGGGDVTEAYTTTITSSSSRRVPHFSYS